MSKIGNDGPPRQAGSAVRSPATSGAGLPRVLVRNPVEADRGRFVELFGDEEFMVFSGLLSTTAAHARFERVLANAARLPFAKQPVIAQSSGVIVGVRRRRPRRARRSAVARARLPAGARGTGHGYATEASRLVLAQAAGSDGGEILAIIDPVNRASENVARKLGFRFWKQAHLETCLRNLYRPRVA